MTQMSRIMKQLSESRQTEAEEPLEYDRLQQTLGVELIDQLPFLLGSLLDEIPVRLSQIDCAIRGGAWPEALRMAHGLKGTSRWFAADALELAALELEEACRVGNVAIACRSANKIRLEANRLEAWLAHYNDHS